MTAPDGLLARWYAPLAAGLLPLLLVGFAWSALADRIAFVGWALAAAAGYAILLRHGLERGWAPGRRVASLAVWLALALAAFAGLEAEHHEILDLGFRAVLPDLYHQAAIRPSTALVLAFAMALIAAVAAVAAVAGARSVAAQGSARRTEGDA